MSGFISANIKSLHKCRTVGLVCTTEPACLCSSSGQECCCIPGHSEVGRCRVCGAPILVIDFETGEPLATKPRPGLVVTLSLGEEDRQLVLLALAVLSLRSPGFDAALNRVACRIDNVTRQGRADMYEAFRLARRDIEEPGGQS